MADGSVCQVGGCALCGSQIPAERMSNSIRMQKCPARYCSGECQRKARRRRHYLYYRDRECARQRAKMAALSPEQAKEIKRKRRVAQRARYKEAGLTIRGTLRRRAPNNEPRTLWEQNAKQAWHWWLKACPDWWLVSYYEAQGKPWANPRLTAAEKFKAKYAADPRFVLYHRLKRWMHKHLRNATRDRGSKNWGQVLGYQPEDLRAHIEALFVDGMSWDNMGDWHIDHIRPVNTFSFTTHEDPEFAECYALSNLRPLWARDNLRRPKDGSDVKGLCQSVSGQLIYSRA